MRNREQCEQQATREHLKTYSEVVPKEYHKYMTGIKRNLMQTLEITESAF
jgi:hypothetical protein